MDAGKRKKNYYSVFYIITIIIKFYNVYMYYRTKEELKTSKEEVLALQERIKKYLHLSLSNCN